MIIGFVNFINSIDKCKNVVISYYIAFYIQKQYHMPNIFYKRVVDIFLTSLTTAKTKKLLCQIDQFLLSVIKSLSTR